MINVLIETKNLKPAGKEESMIEQYAKDHGYTIHRAALSQLCRDLGLMIMSNIVVKHHHLYPEGIPKLAPRPTRDNEQAWPDNTVIVWVV